MTDAEGTYPHPLPPKSESVSAQPTPATPSYKSPTSATGPSTLPKIPHSPPLNGVMRKAGTDISWGSPAGLQVRGLHEEYLVIFRKALGINFHRDCAEGCTLEEGRKSAIGIHKIFVMTLARKRMQHAALMAFLYNYGLWVITALGALNTVLAGIPALIKGSERPQKPGRDRVEYRKLQTWIGETEALLAVGVIGRNRTEVGLLVECSFERYSAAMASDENN
ncbi:hypothetical protein DL770_007983 [Monosporascus sp. CRB-9-2]|nr:hypothetical protein DL770_007983 [Monosporascus sp. CRB-9-2]